MKNPRFHSWLARSATIDWFWLVTHSSTCSPCSSVEQSQDELDYIHLGLSSKPVASCTAMANDTMSTQQIEIAVPGFEFVASYAAIASDAAFPLLPTPLDRDRALARGCRSQRCDQASNVHVSRNPHLAYVFNKIKERRNIHL